MGQQKYIRFYLPDGNRDWVAGSQRPSNKHYFCDRSWGLHSENFTALLQYFHMKPFNAECLAQVWRYSSAVGLPVRLLGLPKVAHCVLGQLGLAKPMMSFSRFPPQSPQLNNKSHGHDGADEAEIKAGSTPGK